MVKFCVVCEYITFTCILAVTSVTADSDITSDVALAKARQVLLQYPLVDGHNDLPDVYRERIQNRVNNVNLSIDVTPQWGPSHTDIPRLRAGQVGSQFWAAYISCSKLGKDAVRAFLEQIDVIQRFTKQYPDDFEIVTSADGIESAFADGKIGCMIGVEGGHAIDSSLAVLRLIYDMGGRYLGLTHNCNTPWATNAEEDQDPPVAQEGLTEFGRTVIAEMNRLGMLIDLAHVSKATMIDVLNTTLAPVITSHSSVWALCNHERNIQDDVLQMIADNGGLVMVTFVPGFLHCPPSSGYANVTHVADHIEYIRDVVGVDYVGIGSDYDGTSEVPIGMEDTSTFPNLFAELIQRGWPDPDLEKLAGRNLVRVFRAVEQVRDNMMDIDPYDEYVPPGDLPENSCRTTE